MWKADYNMQNDVHIAGSAHTQACTHKHTQLSFQKMFQAFIVPLPHKRIQAYSYDYVSVSKSYYFILMPIF